MVDNDSERSTQLRKEVKMNSFSSNYRNVILIPNEAGLKLIESFEPNNDLRQVLISQSDSEVIKGHLSDPKRLLKTYQDLRKSVIIKLNQ